MDVHTFMQVLEFLPVCAHMYTCVWSGSNCMFIHSSGGCMLKFPHLNVSWLNVVNFLKSRYHKCHCVTISICARKQQTKPVSPTQEIYHQNLCYVSHILFYGLHQPFLWCLLKIRSPNSLSNLMALTGTI